jgi:hypothetical protein
VLSSWGQRPARADLKARIQPALKVDPRLHKGGKTLCRMAFQEETRCLLLAVGSRVAEHLSRECKRAAYVCTANDLASMAEALALVRLCEARR